MAYRHGHYRRGHYRRNRNGTVSWVRGSKVRGHYYDPCVSRSSGIFGWLTYHPNPPYTQNTSYGFYQRQEYKHQYSSYAGQSFSGTRYQNYGNPYYPNISQQKTPYEQTLENRNQSFNNYSSRSNKKSFLLAGIFVLFLATTFFVGVSITSFSIRNLCAQGQYEDAYKKANDKLKTVVEAENVIAYLSGMLLDDSFTENSFVLLNAWYQTINNSNKVAVLHTQITDRFGTKKDNYALWICDKDRDEWEFYTVVDDLDKEVNSFTLYEQLERSLIKLTIENKSTALPKTSVKNINNLYNKDMLDKVVLLKRQQ